MFLMKVKVSVYGLDKRRSAMNSSELRITVFTPLITAAIHTQVFESLCDRHTGASSGLLSTTAQRITPGADEEFKRIADST